MKTQIGIGCAVAAAALALAGCGSSTGGKQSAKVPAKPASTSASPSVSPSVSPSSSPMTINPGGPIATTSAAPTPAPTTAAPAPTTSAAPRPTQTHSASSGGSRCHTSDLRGSLGRFEGAAGSRYGHIILTNVSGRTCTIEGYGGLSLAGAPSHQNRDPSQPPVLVRLAPNASASAQIRVGDVPVGSESESGPCEPTPSALLVIPPDETTQLRITWGSGPACGRGAITQGAYRTA